MTRYSWALVLALLAAGATAVWAADVSGAWSGEVVFRGSSKPLAFTLDLKPDGGKLGGTFCARNCGAANAKVDIENGKIDGDNVWFSVMTDASDLPRMDFRGTVSGDTMQFAVSGNPPECDGTMCQVGQGSATRAQ